MSYEFTDPGLNEAIRRFADTNVAEELQIAQAFLEKYVNACESNDDVIAGAPVVLAYTTKIPLLRQKFWDALIDNKVYIHRDQYVFVLRAVCGAVAEVLKPIDPKSLLIDQIAASIGKAMQDAIQKTDSEPRE
jgi:hypothetical protein